MSSLIEKIRNNGKSYFIQTFGCQMNEHDSETIAGMLEEMGYVESPSRDTADIIVMNTCSVRENADNRFFGQLGIMKKVRELYPNKNVWCFTGYVYDRDLVPGGRKYTEDTDEMLDMIDVLVDGPFIQEERDLRIKFRGSRNQRLIDMKKTRECGTIVLMNL